MKNNQKQSYQNIEKIIFFAAVGVLQGSAMTSCGTLITTIANDLNYDSLGIMSLLINNVSAALFTFIAPSVVSRLPYRMIFFICSCTCTFFILEGVLMSSCQNHPHLFYCPDAAMYPIVALCSIIFGFGSPVTTIATSMYISQNTDSTNKGLFYGLLSTFGQSSILIGNVLGMFVVEALGKFYYFVLMCIVTMASGTLYLLFLKNPGEKIYDEVELLELEELKRFQSRPVLTQMKEVGVCISRPNLRLLLAYMFQGGFIPGIEAGGLSQLVERAITTKHPTYPNNKVQSMIARIGIVVGIFEMVGGQSIMWLGDKFEKRNFARFNNLTYQIGIFGAMVLLINNYYESAYFLAPFWGFTDCVGQTLNFALISERFGDDLKAFSVYALINNVGTSIAMAIAFFYQNSVGYTICIYFGLVMVQQIITNFSLTLLKPKNEFVEQVLSQSKMNAKYQPVKSNLNVSRDNSVNVQKRKVEEKPKFA